MKKILFTVLFLFMVYGMINNAVENYNEFIIDLNNRCNVVECLASIN